MTQQEAFSCEGFLYGRQQELVFNDSLDVHENVSSLQQLLPFIELIQTNVSSILLGTESSSLNQETSAGEYLMN